MWRVDVKQVRAPEAGPVPLLHERITTGPVLSHPSMETRGDYQTSREASLSPVGTHSAEMTYSPCKGAQ